MKKDDDIYGLTQKTYDSFYNAAAEIEEFVPGILYMPVLYNQNFNALYTDWTYSRSFKSFPQDYFIALHSKDDSKSFTKGFMT